ncbi:hypothetical protein AAF712_012966 [Marasmius tenuissimus]|uniref:Cytochrome P450 n=1 Tax=Marasmius tenuissimus TaxID=585030 RepID=A0ABR2ZH33_9AGAR
MATSIVLYRISPFHPLANVPGPMIFKITKFWRMYICWTGKQHIMLKGLHDRYGPIVRSGPNDISVINHSSVKEVLGSEGLPKGPAYLARSPVGIPPPLIVTTGEEHTNRRRVWGRGFSSESIKEYQQIIVARANELTEGLSARVGQEINLMDWMNFLAFDFMAEMAFGTKTGMLKHGKDDSGVIELIHASAWFGEILSHNDEEGHEAVKPRPDLVGPDSVAAIIAGSDTTSTAMANFFWCILSHPEAYKRVISEVDKEYPPGTDPLLDTSQYANLTFLKACLNESLRVLPPVPSNGPRVVPQGSGGKIICGHFISEGTQVQVPPMCVHYSPDNFSPSPEAFIPERWIPKDSKTVFKGAPTTMRMDAFIPFSYGPANCVGKNLAMSEMTMVLTVLIQKFHFRFVEGFEWKEWPGKKVDAFLTDNGPLKVTVEPRV